MNKYEELLGIVVVAIFIGIIVYFFRSPQEPPQKPVFEFQDHKELPDGQHRYEIYHQGIRSGYVVLPGSMSGVKIVVVAVHD
jgi:hypothetical protein